MTVKRCLSVTPVELARLLTGLLRLSDGRVQIRVVGSHEGRGKKGGRGNGVLDAV